MAFVEPDLLCVLREGIGELELGGSFFGKIIIALALVQGNDRAALADGETLREHESEFLPLCSGHAECPVEPGLLGAPELLMHIDCVADHPLEHYVAGGKVFINYYSVLCPAGGEQCRNGGDDNTESFHCYSLLYGPCIDLTLYSLSVSSST